MKKNPLLKKGGGIMGGYIFKGYRELLLFILLIIIFFWFIAPWWPGKYS